MSRWHISETKQLIEQRHGSNQLLLARHCLRSVNERLRHARYHYQEAKRNLKEHIDDQLSCQSIHALTWATKAETRDELDDCLMKVEAHMIACAQAIHSIADNLAHVVYYALGLNLPPHSIKVKSVTIRRIAQVLSEKETPFTAIARPLQALLLEQSFATVDAMVNVTKHRGLSESRLSIEPPDRETPYAMEFGAFSYDGKEFPAREIEDVLAPAYAAASRAVIDTGNALNTALA
jgi:hypothetical protein